jgi:hypothetical protein
MNTANNMSAILSAFDRLSDTEVRRAAEEQRPHGAVMSRSLWAAKRALVIGSSTEENHGILSSVWSVAGSSER